MKRVGKTIILSVAAVAAVACGGNGSKKENEARTAAAAEALPVVEVTKASARDVDDSNSYSSTVQAFAVNNIMPQAAGRIRAINVEVGDYVTAGQVLARMDDLSLEQARLQLVNDSTELSRLRALYEEGGVAKSDLEAMELSYNVRRTSYENLEENTVLRSPVTGFVTARNYDRNDMYSMSQPIFTVQQVVPVKLLVGISETEYTKVKKGDAVEISADAIPGRVFNGRVNRLYPTVDAATHTFQAEQCRPRPEAGNVCQGARHFRHQQAHRPSGQGHSEAGGLRTEIRICAEYGRQYGELRACDDRTAHGERV